MATRKPKVSNSRPARWGRAVESGLDASRQLEEMHDERVELQEEEAELLLTDPRTDVQEARLIEVRERLQEIEQTVQDLIDTVNAALEQLEDLRGEYESWYDNLPENLQDSNLGSKLSEITYLSFDVIGDSEDAQDATQALEEAENADLPLGFGRD